MAETTTAGIQMSPGSRAKTREAERFPAKRRWGLGGITLISIFLNFFQLGQNGFGNLYYAAGVRSMLDSVHTFFFVSYDPGGFVSIDKPPLGFWLQVASAKLFGFTPFSLFFPQALAGVLSVLLLYTLVSHHFGAAAGLLAALALALSPLSVATNRNNTIDSVLTLFLLLGAWAALRAAESGRLRWLLLCAVMVGLGFNVKMLQAYLALPAYGLLYLLAAPGSMRKRIGHLALAVLVVVVISLSWVLVVDRTPTNARPYVGSSADNSELSLAIGYNGIQRLFGPGFSIQTLAVASRAISETTPHTGMNAGPLADLEGIFESGAPGPLRLFNQPLAGQIAWLLPFAILGAIAFSWQRPLRLREDRQQQSLLLWGVYLLTMAAFFSVATFIHQYYLVIMAPAICALFGIGLVVLWRDYHRPGWRAWMLPLALVITVIEQVHILTHYPAWGRWLIPLIVSLCVLAVGMLLAGRIDVRLGQSTGVRTLRPAFLFAAMSIGTLSILLATTIWAALPAIQGTAPQVPAAGPGQTTGSNGNIHADTSLVRYLEANKGSATYLVATSSSAAANALILLTNKPVLALGGFGGSDPILSPGQLSALVANGTVRFFLLNAPRAGQTAATDTSARADHEFSDRNTDDEIDGGGGQQGALASWVAQRCNIVPMSHWSSAGDTAQVLYDCAVLR